MSLHSNFKYYFYRITEICSWRIAKFLKLFQQKISIIYTHFNVPLTTENMYDTLSATLIDIPKQHAFRLHFSVVNYYRHLSFAIYGVHVLSVYMFMFICAIVEYRMGVESVFKHSTLTRSHKDTLTLQKLSCLNALSSYKHEWAYKWGHDHTYYIYIYIYILVVLSAHPVET